MTFIQNQSPPTLRRKQRISNFRCSHTRRTHCTEEGTPGLLLQRDDQTPIPRNRGPRISYSNRDRFITGRDSTDYAGSYHRVSKIPATLSKFELYYRTRDISVDPFSPNRRKRSRNAVEARGNSNIYRLRAPQYSPSFVHGNDAPPTPSRIMSNDTRRSSFGNFWNIGGRIVSGPGFSRAISTGSGPLLASGTTSPMHTPPFLDQDTEEDYNQDYSSRLSFALDIDHARRILRHMKTEPPPAWASEKNVQPFGWKNTAWSRGNDFNVPFEQRSRFRCTKSVPSLAFRVLDAPRLKDDYYCSILAYSQTFNTLAVALGHKVYLWTEQYGVRYPPLFPVRTSNYVTSLAFSSDKGSKGILAIARHSGNVTLWSVRESIPRIQSTHPCAASCLAFRPKPTQRYSITHKRLIDCEDLVIGDDSGKIYLYSIEWPDVVACSMTLLAKIDAHRQNICGIAWSPNGKQFVTGGNDNLALLFDIDLILDCKHRSERSTPKAFPSSDKIASRVGHLEQSQLPTPPESPVRSQTHRNIGGMNHEPTQSQIGDIETPPSTPPSAERIRGRSPSRLLPADVSLGSLASALINSSDQLLETQLIDPDVPGLVNVHIYAFHHSAAVKAIAFAPWQENLLATGGGSHDRQIRFHHVASGASLAVINAFAQVTSLVWSRTRREIAATFGYAQPDHDIRVAVFAWPSCECVVRIPWEKKANGEVGRALWAIPYPGGPNDAVPSRWQDENDGFATWEAVRLRAARLEQRSNIHDQGDHRRPIEDIMTVGGLEREVNVRLESTSRRTRSGPVSRRDLRGEGERWASRTEEEGSLIIACCDQTVKFFEVWAGRSKGKGIGLGSKEGVLGGSRILEGWCEGVNVDEIGNGELAIR